MGTFHLYVLLGELRDQLIDESRLVGGVSRRRRRRELLGRVRSALAVGADYTAPSKLVEAVRHDWTSDRRVRIDDVASWCVDSAGVWIGAWILAETGAAAFEGINPERLAAAIVALQPLARDVFTLHCRDDLDYPSVATRLAISEETVRRELAAALVALDQALDDQPGDDVSAIA